MRISDWSSDVCSSNLSRARRRRPTMRRARATPQRRAGSGGAEYGGSLASWDRIVRTIGGGPVDFIARGRGVVTQHAVIGADRILRTDEVGARQRLFAIEIGRAHV